MFLVTVLFFIINAPTYISYPSLSNAMISSTFKPLLIKVSSEMREYLKLLTLMASVSTHTPWNPLVRPSLNV